MSVDVVSVDHKRLACLTDTESTQLILACSEKII